LTGGSVGLAEGSAGLALVMSVAMLHTWRFEVASILLAVQSALVALTAVLLQQPWMALSPLVFAASLLAWELTGGAWFARHRTDAPGRPERAAVLGAVSGVILAILCLSHRSLGLPLAIMLLAVLFAATRRHPPLQVMALVAVQNGLALSGCLVVEPALLSPVLLPVVCLVLPLPLGAHLLIPAETRRAADIVASPERIDLALSFVIFVATLTIPLDGLASVFAPLLGFDAVIRSCRRRNRKSLRLPHRIFVLLQSSFVLLAVCAPNMIVAWLALVGSLSTFLLPRLRITMHFPLGLALPGDSSPTAQVLPSISDRSAKSMTVTHSSVVTSRPGAAALAMPSGFASTRLWDEAVVAFSGAGLALFGLLMISSLTSILGYFSLFVGLATIAAVVPDLAVVSMILLLRLATQSQWPADAEALGSLIALIVLLACTLRLFGTNASHRVTLLQLGQCGVAFLAICVGQADGRFAALVLLVLLILTRCAASGAGGFAPMLAVAGLGGLPPLGVFPAVVLVIMVISSIEPWLLLPLGLALVPLILASLPRRPVAFSFKVITPSLGWLPLALALLVGYCAPDGLVRWWHVLTAGRS
jgi:hypothetical protein